MSSLLGVVAPTKFHKEKLKFPPDEEPHYKAIHRAADRAVPSMVTELEWVIEGVRRALDLGQLERALSLRSWAQVEQAIPLQQFNDFSLIYRHIVRGVMEEAARAEQRLINRKFSAAGDSGKVSKAEPPRVVGSLNITNPETLKWIDEHAAERVTAITEDTRQSIRTLVGRSFREGIPPWDTARLIREHIGLTPKQSLALANFHTGLTEQGLRDDKVRAQTERYSQRLIRDRALTIARTETITAANTGQQMLWDQNSKLLPKDRTKKEWIVTPDDALCPYCAALGSKPPIVVNTEFKSEIGNVMNPTLHPRCRCAIGLVFEPAPEVTEEELEEKPPPALHLSEQAQQLSFHREIRARIEKTQQEAVREKVQFQPNEAEAQLLLRWTGSSYIKLLSGLRGTVLDSNLQYQLDTLRGMAEKYEYNVARGTPLYRGMSGDVESLGRFLRMKKGDVVEINDTFSSFSSSRSAASQFSRGSDVSVLVKLDHESPWGWDIKKFSTHRSEREVLVPRTTGRVKSIKVKSLAGGMKRVEVVMEAVEKPPQLGYYGQRLGERAVLSDVLEVGDIVGKEVDRRAGLLTKEIRSRGEALRSETSRLMTQLANLGKLPDQTEAIRVETRRLVKKIDLLSQERQLLATSYSSVEKEALKSVLQEVRPMGIGGTVESAYPKMAANSVRGKNQVTPLRPDFEQQPGWEKLENSFQDVINSLPRDWVTESSRGADVGRIVWGESFGGSSNRAFYKSQYPGDDWRIGVPNTPHYASTKQQLTTLSHELGHRVEDSVEGARNFVREFYQYRTKGEKPIPLGKGYVGEMTKKDKFTSPYIGKVYADGNTEVLSMGLQQALGAEGFGVDKEFRQFIFGLLAAG